MCFPRGIGDSGKKWSCETISNTTKPCYDADSTDGEQVKMVGDFEITPNCSVFETTLGMGYINHESLIFIVYSFT